MQERRSKLPEKGEKVGEITYVHATPLPPAEGQPTTGTRYGRALTGRHGARCHHNRCYGGHCPPSWPCWPSTAW